MRAAITFTLVTLVLATSASVLLVGCGGVDAGPIDSDTVDEILAYTDGDDPDNAGEQRDGVFQTTPRIGETPLEVAVAVIDPEENALYGWDFGEGTVAAGANASHVYTEPGVYEIMLAAQTSAGESFYSIDEVYVLPDYDFEYTEGDDPLEIKLRVSPDPLAFDHGIEGEFTWSFDDGTETTGAEARHVYSQQGRYAVILTFVTALGSVQCSQQLVTVPASDRSQEPGLSMLLVTPMEGIDSSGPVGGPFDPDHKSYTIENTGTTTVEWSVSLSGDWISFISPTSGLLAAGASATVTVALDEDAYDKPVGQYEATFLVEDLNAGEIVAQEIMSLAVESPSEPPRIAVLSDESIFPGRGYSRTPTLLQGSTPVNWGLLDGPADMTIDTSSGKVSWPNPQPSGSSFQVTIIAVNSVGNDQKTWTLTIDGTEPVIVPLDDDATVPGMPYTRTPQLSEGTGTISWTLIEGPTGMTIDDATGVVTWANPQPAGSQHNITIRASNAAGSDDESWTLTVAAIAPVIAPMGDDAVNPGMPYSRTPSLNDGTAPIEWTLVQGPSGMSINSSTGEVSWANPQPANSSHPITIRAANSAGNDDESWTLTVSAIAPVIAPMGDDAVDPGQAYSRTPSLNDGTAPIEWTLVQGPSGMSINSSTGEVTWDDPQPADSQHTITIRATNSAGSDDESWTLTVAAVAPVITPLNDDAVDPGQAYSRTPTLNEGSAPVTWSLVQGPAGMSINSSTGTASWTNPQPEDSQHTITIRATNSAGSDDESWTLTVAAVAPVITPLNDDAVDPGEAYSRTPTLSEGSAPVTWSLVQGPAGMSINSSTGQVSWTNPQPADSQHTVTIRATNSAGSDDESWTLTVAAVAPVIAPLNDDAVDPGEAYSRTPALSEGSAPITWTLVQGPSGMSINSSTGTVSWTNPQPADSQHTVTIRATNSAGSDDESWTLTVAAIAPVIAPLNDDAVDPGEAYSRTPTLSEGSAPITWSLVQGPAGMSINSSTGTVSWTNPQPEDSQHTITIRATNSAGSDDESWTLTVAAVAPVIAPLNDDAVDPGEAYSRTPSLDEGTTPVLWTLVEHPNGMTINGSTGQVSWTDPQPADSQHTITIRATNSAGSDDESWTLTVNALAPVIAAMNDDSVNPGQAYSRTPALSEGSAPITWTLVQGPSGMSINSSTGTVSWTDPQPADSQHTITIRATNSAGSDDESWTLTVAAIAPVIVAMSDDSVDPGQAYSRTPSLDEGTTPVLWTLGEHPDGMTINGSTGQVSWTNPQPADSQHTVTIRATNSAGSDDESWTLTVNAESADCETATTEWQNFEIESQNGLFTVEYDAVPLGAAIDGVTALSSGVASAHADCAVLIRFSSAGQIDARDGSSYRSDAAVSYASGTTYHFRVVVNVPGHTYSVYVTPEGSGEQTLAVDYAFRTEQAGVTTLDHWALMEETGTGFDVCDFTLVSAPRLLSVSPSNTFESSGDEGGPFTPGAKVYTLENQGAESLNWSVSVDANWLTLSPATSGGLAGGATTTITATINGNADALESGSYTAQIDFVNETDGVGDTSRAVALEISGLTAPVIAAIGNHTTQPGESYSRTATLTQGTLPVTWTLTTGPSGLAIDADTGVVTWADPQTPESEHTITIRATNSAGYDEESWQLTIGDGETQTAGSITHDGITWTFDGDYQVGQFVTGDWWVIPPTPDGTVTVVAITKPHSTNGRDGSMLNPMGATGHGYDARLLWYDSSLDVSRSLPLIMSADQSLVSTISWEAGEDGCPSVVGDKPRPTVRRACVLTCLGTAPAADAFRPAYAGTDKRVFQASALRMDLFPNLTAPASTPSVASLEAYFERVWLDHGVNYYFNEYIHPSDNMPWYGQPMAGQVGEAAAALLLNIDSESKRQLLLKLCQLGIDNYGAAAAGACWPANGGHGSGRKFPILLAGLVLNDADMLNVSANSHSMSSWRFGEDEQTFYVTSGSTPDGGIDGLSTTARGYSYQAGGTARSGTASTIQLASNHSCADSYSVLDHTIMITGGTGAGQSRVINDRSHWFDASPNDKVVGITPDWDVVPDSTSQYMIVSGPLDFLSPGDPEYGIRHYAEPVNDNHAFTQSVYRQCCTANAWPGYILAARALGLQDEWDHDALFDYTARYMNTMTGTFRCWSEFTEDMWDTYEANY